MRATRTDAAPTSQNASAPKAWLMWAGGVVIAAQLVAVGLVASRQVEQAAARQAAPVVGQSAVPATEFIAQQ